MATANGGGKITARGDDMTARDGDIAANRSLTRGAVARTDGHASISARGDNAAAHKTKMTTGPAIIAADGHRSCIWIWRTCHCQAARTTDGERRFRRTCLNGRIIISICLDRVRSFEIDGGSAQASDACECSNRAREVDGRILQRHRRSVFNRNLICLTQRARQHLAVCHSNIIADLSEIDVRRRACHLHADVIVLTLCESDTRHHAGEDAVVAGGGERHLLVRDFRNGEKDFAGRRGKRGGVNPRASAHLHLQFSSHKVL